MRHNRHDRAPRRGCESHRATEPGFRVGIEPLPEFGSNPGALAGYVHIPETLKPGAPLVVVLHGCTQSAAAYDAASGWSRLADEQGFALLYPEQQRGNNANLCFNWFEVADTRRGSREALSIRDMIAAVRDTHGIDPDRVFITGLSAGGAMAATMLAVYPEVFAGGGIIAGLPYDSGHGLIQAFDRMRGHGLPSPDRLAASVRDASNHSGPWPRISIWHGSADKTVDSQNADAIAQQWRGVHGLRPPVRPLSRWMERSAARGTAPTGAFKSSNTSSLAWATARR